MKNKVGSFVLMLLCVVLVAAVAVFGISAIDLPGVFEKDAVSKGLDLVGGSSITYIAEPDENSPEDFDMSQALDTVESMLRQRLDTLNLTEATITRVGQDQVRIEIPGIDNPEEAVQKLGSTAKLEFKDSNGNVVLEGKDVKEAIATYGQLGTGLKAQYYVALKLNKDGVEKFANATEEMAKLSSEGANYIAITLDGETISAPSVTERIDSEDCVITGDFTSEEATYLAQLISAGQLPVALREIELRYVGPTLGTQALSTSIFAGGIGILLVMLFMIFVYRLPGFVSAIALVGYMGIFGIVIVYFGINLSLPGIAGIILTIGMAVDSNVIIYERIKEELNVGKSVKAAVKEGFSNAFSAIIDANITTIIAAVVLWYYGSGTVRGFAITLFAGVVIALFTALVVTRVLLVSLSGMKLSAWLFGAKKAKKEQA